MMRPEDIHPVDCQTFEYWCEDTTSPRSTRH
jgi:hypothetical protein